MKNFLIILLSLSLCIFSLNSFSQSIAVGEYMAEGNYERVIEIITSGNQSVKQMDNRTLENLGYSYFMIGDFKGANEVYHELINRRNPKDEYFLLYARVLFITENFSEAKSYYQKYTDRRPNDPIANVHIASCDSLKIWSRSKTEYKAEKFIEINTDYDESSALKKGSDIIYLSNAKSDEEKIEDLRLTFIYKFDGLRSTKIDTHLGDRSILTSVSYDSNNNIYAFSLRPVRRSFQDFTVQNSTIVFAKKENGVISKLSEFTWEDKPANINLSHPSFANNGNRLYFASDMPGGYGGMDLYYSDFNGEVWTVPVNLGKNVNTEFNEVSPYASGDSVLYFSSNGHPGYGNFDVFASYIQGENFSNPINLRAPVSSHGDDLFFRPISEHEFIMTSNRLSAGKRTYNVLKISLPAPVEPVEPEVIEEEPVEPVVEKVHKFSVSSFEVPDVLFEINDYKPSENFHDILAKVADTLKRYDYIKLEVHGFSDQSGPDSFNQRISEKRAESIKSHLIELGVDERKITSKGKRVSNIESNDNLKYHVIIGTVPEDGHAEWYSNQLENKYEIGVFQIRNFFSYYAGSYDTFEKAVKMRDKIREIENFETAFIGYSYFGEFLRDYKAAINRRAELRFVEIE